MPSNGMIPFFWMISSSLKLEKDVFAFPIQWIPTDPQWSNYREIWQKVPLVTGFLNSTKLTIIVTILQILTSSFAAYAFAKLEDFNQGLPLALMVRKDGHLFLIRTL